MQDISTLNHIRTPCQPHNLYHTHKIPYYFLLLIICEFRITTLHIFHKDLFIVIFKILFRRLIFVNIQCKVFLTTIFANNVCLLAIGFTFRNVSRSIERFATMYTSTYITQFDGFQIIFFNFIFLFMCL